MVWVGLDYYLVGWLIVWVVGWLVGLVGRLVGCFSFEQIDVLVFDRDGWHGGPFLRAFNTDP